MQEHEQITRERDGRSPIPRKKLPSEEKKKSFDRGVLKILAALVLFNLVVSAFPYAKTLVGVE